MNDLNVRYSDKCVIVRQRNDDSDKGDLFSCTFVIKRPVCVKIVEVEQQVIIGVIEAE